jgi:hypothetical protein
MSYMLITKRTLVQVIATLLTLFLTIALYLQGNIGQALFTLFATTVLAWKTHQRIFYVQFAYLRRAKLYDFCASVATALLGLGLIMATNDIMPLLAGPLVSLAGATIVYATTVPEHGKQIYGVYWTRSLPLLILGIVSGVIYFYAPESQAMKALFSTDVVVLLLMKIIPPKRRTRWIND